MAVVIAFSMLAAGCQFEHLGNAAAPSPNPTPTDGGATSGTSSFVGTWASAAVTELPRVSSCGNLQWQVTSQTATQMSGTFSALCAGTIVVTGQAAGQLGGSSIPMTAGGSASGGGLAACQFLLTGTAYPEADGSLRIVYTGTTCLGPVSGTDTLRRRTAAPAPAPTPTPTPTPAPPPTSPPTPQPPAPSDPLFGCGGIADKEDLVECIHDHIRPTDEYGAFEVTKRVAWALRGGGAGLLIKNGGENIVSWRGYSFSASRICYPDGHIYKVVSDVGPGGANGPSWQDNSFVDAALYVPAIDPNLQ